MREIEDRALEALLKRTLAEQADEVPFSLTSDVVRARLEDRRRRGSVVPGRRILMLGLAAALLLPIAVFVGSALRTQEGPRITPPDATVPTLAPPSAEPPAPSAPVADRYQALVIRFEEKGAVIVAVRADRQQRVIASIPTEGRRFGDLVPSADGWLARVNGPESEFIDRPAPGSRAGSQRAVWPGRGAPAGVRERQRRKRQRRHWTLRLP
jgi:hypothetical protein